MFDANARYLRKGTMFFAKRGEDLLYCEMLDDDNKNPPVKVIATFQGKKWEGKIIKEKDDGIDWFFMPYQGHFKDGILHDFIHEKERVKASAIIKRLKVNRYD